MRPSTLSAPRVGLVMPARSFSSVDLPEPFSPITPKVVPLRHLEGDAVERGEGLVGREVESRLPVRSALFRVLNWFLCRKRR